MVSTCCFIKAISHSRSCMAVSFWGGKAALNHGKITIMNSLLQYLAGHISILLIISCPSPSVLSVHSDKSTWSGMRVLYQFGVELLRGPPAVHGHQGLCGSGNPVIIEIELSVTVSLRAESAALGTTGQHTALLRVHLCTAPQKRQKKKIIRHIL